MPAPLIPWPAFFNSLHTRKSKPKHLQAWLARWAFTDSGVALMEERELHEGKQLSIEERQKRTALLLIMNGRWLKRQH
jgi:hypothetical protein